VSSYTKKRCGLGWSRHRMLLWISIGAPTWVMQYSDDLFTLRSIDWHDVSIECYYSYAILLCRFSPPHKEHTKRHLNHQEHRPRTSPPLPDSERTCYAGVNCTNFPLLKTASRTNWLLTRQSSSNTSCTFHCRKADAATRRHKLDAWGQ